MRLSLLLAALLLAGCDGYDFSAADAVVQTDASSFDAEQQTNRVVVAIPFTRRSPSGARTVYVGCQPPPRPGLEKLIDGEWTLVYSVIEPGCQSAPFVVDAGEVQRDTLFVSGYLPQVSIEPSFTGGEVAGTYRLVQRVYADVDGDGSGRDLLPLEARVSNTFTLY